LRLFSGSSILFFFILSYTKISPEKNPLIVENAWNEGGLQHWKKGVDIKNTHTAIFNKQMHRIKVLFMKTS